MTKEQLLLIYEYGALTGKINGYWDLAIWRNGIPVVGVSETPYKDKVEPLLRRKSEIRAELKMSDCDITQCKGCPDCGLSLVHLPEGE